MLKRYFKYLIKVLFLVVILSSLLIFNWPYLKGDLGVSYSLERYNVEPTTKPSVIEAATWIDAHRKEEGFFRTLWLPVDDELYDSLRWLDRYKFTADPITDPAGASYVKETWNSLLLGETTHVGSLLGLASVKYVILALESSYRNGLHMQGDPRDLAKILNEQQDLELVVNNTNYLIYKNREFQPQVTVHTLIPVVEGNLVKDIQSVGLGKAIFDFEDWVALPEGWSQLSPFGPRVFPSTSPVHSGNYSVGLNPHKDVSIQSPPLTMDMDSMSLNFSVYIPNDQDFIADNFCGLAIKDATGLAWIRYPLETDNSTADWLVAKNFNNLPTGMWLNLTIDNVGRDWRAVHGSAPMKMPITIILVNNQKNSTIYFDDIVVSSLTGGREHAPEPSGVAYDLFKALNPNMQVYLLSINESVAENIQFGYSSPRVIMGNDDHAYNNTIAIFEIGSKEGFLLGRSGEAYFQFYASRDDIYRAALLGSSLSENITITVISPSNNYPIQRRAPTLYQTEKFFLNRGIYELVVRNEGTETANIRALAIFTKGSEELLDKHATEYSLEKLSNIEYKIYLKNSKPVVIILAESYHPDWQIYPQNFPHFRAYGWENGYYIDKPGQYSFRLFFKEQEVRDLYTAIWAASWLVLIVLMGYTYRREIFAAGRDLRKLVVNRTRAGS